MLPVMDTKDLIQTDSSWFDQVYKSKHTFTLHKLPLHEVYNFSVF